MARQPKSARPDGPATDSGALASEGVPGRRIPIALARHFFQIFVAATAEGLAREGLTNLQFGALVELSRVTGEPDIDQNSLAARMCIDRASTSQLLEELEAMGLVERRVNGADRRARLLRLTSRGERLRARVHPAQLDRQKRVLAALTPDERELLVDLLARVVESNRDLARPGGGRRKPGFQRLISSMSRPLPSGKI